MCALFKLSRIGAGHGVHTASCPGAVVSWFGAALFNASGPCCPRLSAGPASSGPIGLAQSRRDEGAAMPVHTAQTLASESSGRIALASPRGRSGQVRSVSRDSCSRPPPACPGGGNGGNLTMELPKRHATSLASAGSRISARGGTVPTSLSLSLLPGVFELALVCMMMPAASE